MGKRADWGRDAAASVRRLARLAGVDLSYRDSAGRLVRSQPESVRACLETMGIDWRSPDAATERLKHLAGVTDGPWVVWREPEAGASKPAALAIRLPRTARHAELRVAVDDGAEVAWREVLGRPFRTDLRDRERMLWRLELPHEVPIGLHRLHVQTAGATFSDDLVVAPTSLAPPVRKKGWGLFAPVYSLRGRTGLGIGNYGDLADLAQAAARMGAGHVACLPLLPGYFQDPVEVSPYLPVSRLFWNELYLDLSSLPEVAASPEARAVMASSDFVAALGRLDEAPRVDHAGAHRLLRQVVAALAPSSSWPDLRAFEGANPDVVDYARFRAYGERQGTPWRRWPNGPLAGRIEPDDIGGEEAAYWFHLWAQWAARRQLRPGPGAARLFLDLPVGVHPDGYDAWRYRGLFARNVDVGAPPDDFFAEGQNWGFAPLLPGAVGRGGHRYLARILKHHFSACDTLRLDHVMGLHRLYWIPKGGANSDGVYVRYPARLLYATALAEAQRAGASLVGEDLGTVEPAVRDEMARRGLVGLYVVGLDLVARTPGALPVDPTAGAVASFGTHDTPTLAGFLAGADLAPARTDSHRESDLGPWLARQAVTAAFVAYLRRLGWLGSKASGEELHCAILCWLGASPAGLVLASLDDLAASARRHNIPGELTVDGWRVRMETSWHRVLTRPAVADCLRRLYSARRASVDSGQSSSHHP